MTLGAQTGSFSPMSTPLPFSAAGRLPASGDNVAIAIRQLDAMIHDIRSAAFSHTIAHQNEDGPVDPLSAGPVPMSAARPPPEPRGSRPQDG